MLETTDGYFLLSVEGGVVRHTSQDDYVILETQNLTRYVKIND